MTETRHLNYYCQTFVVSVSLTVSQSLSAGGFALIEQGASGLGNAYAGAGAAAEDASTLFTNPASSMYLPARQLSVTGHIIKPSTEFSGSARLSPAVGAPLVSGGQGGDAGSASFVPTLFYNHEFSNGFVFGLGISTPFGLSTEYDANWVGRYHAIESEVVTVNINPSIAYKAAPNLSVGVGISAQYIEATLSQAIEQNSACVLNLLSQGVPIGTATTSCAPVTGDAVGEVEGDDWGFGFNVGLIYELAAGTRIGLSYRSKVDQELEGDASFSNAHPAFTSANVFVPTGVNADVTLPESANLSLYHELTPQWTLLADIMWTRWSRFKELRVRYDSNQPDSVTIEDWDNSMRYALGASYRYDNNWLFRIGAAYDEEPIPNAERRTPRIPGNDRTWLSFGVNYRYSQSLNFDIGYAHLFIKDPRINHSSTTAGTITGTYDNAVDILSAQLNWNF